MKSFFVLVFFFFGTCSVVFSQDIIILKTGDEIKAKVEEVGLDLIKYRKFDNLTGPLYNLEKSKVFMIKYENGSKDVFNEQSEEKKENNNVAAVKKTETHKPLTYSAGSVKQDNRSLNPNEVKSLMAPYPDALHSYNTGKGLKLTAGILDGVSLGLVVATFVQYKSGNVYGSHVTLAMMCGTLLGSLIVDGIGSSKIKNSVNIYNSKAGNPTSLRLFINPNGMGLAYRF